MPSPLKNDRELKTYSRICRQLKAEGLHVEDMPPEIQQSWLYLTQRAITRYMELKREGWEDETNEAAQVPAAGRTCDST